MTKHIQLIYLLLALMLFNVGCDRSLQFSNSDTSKPGINCIIQPADFQAPTLVQQDEKFLLNFNRNDVIWTLSNGNTNLRYEGSQIETSLSEIGTYIGSVSGLNNCNKEEAREFTLRVVEKIEGLRLVINNNDSYTRSLSVNLTLAAQGATEMYVTNDPSCTSGGTWTPLSNQLNWSLSQSNQTARVFAKFKNELVETSCLSDDILHDDIAPVVRFVSRPTSLTSSTSANFVFAAEDNGSGVKNFFCKKDNNNFQVCQLQMSYNQLVSGTHTVSIYAEDLAGNVSAVESYTWTVDTSLPTVRITQTPSNPSNSSSAQFRFEGTDNGQPLNNFECSLDGSSFQTCATPRNYSGLSQGNHVFRVRSKDAAGNLSPEASYSWTIDSLAPVIQITSAPALLTKETQALFNFTVQDSGSGVATVTCQLDSNPAVNCLNSISYTSLSNSVHVFRIVAQDRAGNSSSAIHTWEVNDKITDQVIPVVDSAGATDIIFLMNTTGSMFDIYEGKIRNQFRNFLSTLGNTDYKIGIVTGDYRGGNSPYREGRIVPLEETPILYEITPQTNRAQTRFLETISRREVTCVYGTWTGPNKSFCGRSGWNLPVSNQLIRTSLMTFDHPDNAFFFRPQASLNVVIVSDTDEICASGRRGADGACDAQDTQHSPEAFIQNVHRTHPGKELKVHSLVHRPGDRGCDMGPSNAGYTYMKLSQMTGGTTASVCRNFSSEGTAIANAITSASQQVFQLRCAPVDTNRDGVVDGNDVSVSFSPALPQNPQVIVSGNSIRFSPTVPAGTQISLRYICP